MDHSEIFKPTLSIVAKASVKLQTRECIMIESARYKTPDFHQTYLFK